MRRLLAAALLAAALAPTAHAADPAKPVRPTEAEVKAVVDKAYAAMRGKQNADGSFAPKLGGPGVTALMAAAFLKAGKPVDDPLVAGCLKYLESSVQKDGGVYARGLANYTTCLAVVTFKEANGDGRYDAVIANAAKFLRGLQDADADPKSLAYGGVGYDGKGRPDLSNTQFFVEALRAAGAPESDPAIRKALAFVSRSQNLPGEFNDQPFAARATEDDKGGFVYNPTDQTNAKSDKRTPQGGLRSEGGMTYAGLKSFLYAGLTRDDPRVKAALNWVGRHYTVAENPGQGQAGYYYFTVTFARAMTQLGQETFTDAAGKPHAWKRDLFDALAARQKPDGTWANDNKAYLENQPELATAFAVLALGYCR